MNYRLVPFGADMPAPIRDLSQLHAVLLPTSLVSLLGQRFMERFYYSILPRESLIFGWVAYVDSQPAGFVAATHDSAGFMRSALRRWWPYLIWVVGISVLSAPKSIGGVWEALQAMRSRRPIPSDEPEGEILSLGVLSAYREARFIGESGRRISTELLDAAVTQLLARGIRVIRTLVRAENTQTKLFYCGLGWTQSRTGIPGYRGSSVEFRWQPNARLLQGVPFRDSYRQEKEILS